MARFERHRRYALLFILPQLLVTVVFFLWPAGKAIEQSLFYADAFGLQQRWSGIANYLDLFADPAYLKALVITLVIAGATTGLTMGFGLFLAVLIAQRTKTQSVYKSLLIWPYAIAPAVAAILWRFLCHPTLGWMTDWLSFFGIQLDYINNSCQALLVIIITATWQQFSYNFLFYYSALKAVPQSLIDAAIMDGATPWQRFWHIIVPIISPTTFFLLVMNIIYGFFDTFGIIHVLTHGGPGNSTTNLIYKVYQDGFEGMDIGSSAAQSVVLMIVVIAVTSFQFKYVEKKVHY